jgi:Tol biopolymer transport system component
MVTADGRVKVLAFGLAKLKDVAAEESEGSRLTAVVTGEGRIFGTVAYMSPEQAQGGPLDHRSDVFSLGVLLYEMATGERPFKGDTAVSIVSAILKDTPGSVTDLRPDLPRDFVRIVKRALNKDPEHRYQSAKDLRNDLETLKEDLDSGEIAKAPGGLAPGGRQGLRPVLVVGLVLVAVMVVSGTWWTSRVLRPPEKTAAARRYFDDFSVTRLTTEQASDYTVAVSRDGRYVAYAFIERGRQGLRVRQTETPAAVQVVPPADVSYNGVTFSPDGNRLYYATYPRGSTVATLYEVPVLGGSPRRVIEDVDCRISFSPDGARFAFLRSAPGESASVVIANADGAGERVLATRDVPNDFVTADIAWSGDGRRIAAAVADGSMDALVTVDVATGAVQTVGGKRWDTVYSIEWPPEGAHLIVAAGDFRAADALQVWEVALADGAVRRITKDMGFYTAVSLTADAHTIVAARQEWQGTLWVAPSAQPDRLARVGSVPETVSLFSRVRWTPDGRILYTARVAGNYDVWAVRPDGGDLRQLTSSPGLDGDPALAPDGGHIVFVSDRDGHGRLWRMDPDGGRQTLLTNGTIDSSPLVAADGRRVFYRRDDQPGYPLYVTPIEGGEPSLLSGPSSLGPSLWKGVPAGFWPGELSPDGSLILGSFIDDQHRRRLAVVPADGQGAVRTLAIALESARGYAWAPDGRAVTVARTTEGAWNIWRQPLDGAPATRLTAYPPGDDIVLHTWSRDGKLLALVRNASQRQVVMLRETPAGR